MKRCEVEVRVVDFTSLTALQEELDAHPPQFVVVHLVQVEAPKDMDPTDPGFAAAHRVQPCVPHLDSVCVGEVLHRVGAVPTLQALFLNFLGSEPWATVMPVVTRAIALSWWGPLCLDLKPRIRSKPGAGDGGEGEAETKVVSEAVPEAEAAAAAAAAAAAEARSLNPDQLNALMLTNTALVFQCMNAGLSLKDAFMNARVSTYQVFKRNILNQEAAECHHRSVSTVLTVETAFMDSARMDARGLLSPTMQRSVDSGVTLGPPPCPPPA